MKNTSLAVDVRCSKTSLLKLPDIISCFKSSLTAKGTWKRRNILNRPGLVCRRYVHHLAGIS